MLCSGGQVDTAFISNGFDNWKKVWRRGVDFRNITTRSHAFAEKAYKNFIQAKSVNTQLSEEREREVSRRQEIIR